MKRCVLLIVTLTLISTLAVAQAVVTPSGQATTAGVAVPVAPIISPPLVTTPLMHLGNAATVPAGNSANPNAEPPSAVPIRPEIDLGPETIYIGQSNAGANNGNAANTAAPATGRGYVDLGVNSNAAVAVTDGTQGRSLGDIARENRQRMQGANARTFTNADVQRMAGAGGVTGIATNPANNGYPPDNGVINSTGAIAAPANGTAADQNTPQATPPATEQNQKPSAATPPQMAQAQTPTNPADQNAQSSAAAGQDTQQRTLPKSASPLPLLGILGFTAILVGLVVRRARA